MAEEMESECISWKLWYIPWELKEPTRRWTVQNPSLRESPCVNDATCPQMIEELLCVHCSAVQYAEN